MADALCVSPHHLAKVVQALHAAGWITTTRGRGGGVVLCADPARLRIGDVVRVLEPDMGLVECFRPECECPLVPSCGLIGALDRAREAFLGELDKVTLRSVVKGRERNVLGLTVGGRSEGAR